MRALFGSLRLTKDIDFERAPSLSNDSLERRLPRELTNAALGAGLLDPKVAITKLTATTVRASLNARLSGGGEPLQYEVEVSGRGLPPAAHLVRVNATPPTAYRMTHFGVNSYDAHAMAATKIAALHADNRSVPRDIFDLNDLIGQNAQPVDLLRAARRDWLEAIDGRAIEKTAAIGWDRADQELLPYLPRSVRDALDADAWEILCLRVAEKVDAWVREAQS